MHAHEHVQLLFIVQQGGRRFHRVRGVVSRLKLNMLNMMLMFMLMMLLLVNLLVVRGMVHLRGQGAVALVVGGRAAGGGQVQAAP